MQNPRIACNTEHVLQYRWENLNLLKVSEVRSPLEQKVNTMERLDQGHLHPRGPETDMSRPGIKPGLQEASTLAKSYSKSYSEHLHISPQHGSPQLHVVT
jgi:hypothetical protein